MTQDDPKGYYAALGVGPGASCAEIKRAFRQLAKAFHPDRNSEPSAKARFQRINEAYQVLGDSKARQAYDSALYDTAGPRVGAQNDYQPISCSVCKQVTAQPRYVVFTYVASAIFATSRRPIQGIFCSSCARKVGLKASAIAAIAGWWGFPVGPFWTVAAIFRNLMGGLHRQKSDQAMLWFNALAFLQKGDATLAYALARELRRADDENIAISAVRLMDTLTRRGIDANSAPLKNPWTMSWRDRAAHGAMLLAIPLMLTGFAYQSELVRWWAQIEGPPDFDDTGISPDADVQAPRFKVVSRPPVAAPSSKPPVCANPPGNGHILAGSGRRTGSSHTLEIRNGSQGDAIVKVRDAQTGALTTSFFVKASESATTRLRDGAYLIQYAVGQTLGPDCATFAGDYHASQFPGIKTLATTYTQEQIITQQLVYTLYSVPSGNVRPRTLDRASFERN